MIQLINLTKKFRNVAVVDNLNLKIHPGEIFGFLGPNGAGKTTTVKMLTGLVPPTAGSAVIFGHDIQTNSKEAKSITGLVPDEPYVYPKLTGVEFLRFSADLYSVPLDCQRRMIPEYLDMFELNGASHDLVESYSHGMRQKLLFASVLIRNPKALILDEPLVGLDPKSSRLIRELIISLARNGTAVFMCTHILDIAEKLCTRIGIIVKGRLIALGSLAELKERAAIEGNLEEVFFTLTEDPHPFPSPRGRG